MGGLHGQEASSWFVDTGPFCEDSLRAGCPSSVHQAGEVHTLNADAVCQHLAGILSASQTRATYLK